jgi:hypothetical protein
VTAKTHNDFAWIRSRVDGKDQFVTGSQVRSSARTSNAKRVRKTPKWVNDDKAVKQILQRVFPKMFTDKRQRKQALLWNAIIYYWWRAGEPETRAINAINESRSDEDKITAKQLHDTIYRIRRVVEKGLTTSGKPRNRPKSRPMGRPRKKPMDDGPDEWGDWEPWG